MDVKMKSESKTVAVPYYSYDNGTNIRFITLEEIGSHWKVGSIAIGP